MTKLKAKHKPTEDELAQALKPSWTNVLDILLAADHAVGDALAYTYEKGELRLPLVNLMLKYPILLDKFLSWCESELDGCTGFTWVSACRMLASHLRRRGVVKLTKRGKTWHAYKTREWRAHEKRTGHVWKGVAATKGRAVPKVRTA